MTHPAHRRFPIVARRPTGLLAGAVLSAAFHAAALALIIGTGAGEDTPPMPILAVEVIDSRTLPAGPTTGAIVASDLPADADTPAPAETLPPAAESPPVPPEPSDPPPVETAEAVPAEPPSPPEPSAARVDDAPPPDFVTRVDATEPVEAVPTAEPLQRTEAVESLERMKAAAVTDAPVPPQPVPPPPARKPPAPDPFPAAAARPPDDRPRRPPTAAVPPAAVPPAARGHAPAVTAAAGSPVAASPGRTIGARAISSPRPYYPMTARRRGLEGRVLLRVRVSPSGVPDVVELAESSGVASLDDAAAEAVRRWRFSPALRDGVAVAALVDIPVRFRLEED